MAYNITASNKVTASDRATVIANMLNSSEGRFNLAANMSEPLRQFRDYTGIGRKAFVVDDLGQGEMAIYDKDVDTPAFIVAEEGSDVQVIVRGSSVRVPLFEIASTVEIPMTKIRERRYDLQTRVKEKTKTEIVRVEDKYIFDMFAKIATSPRAANPQITVAKANLSIDTFSEAKALIEQWGDVNAYNMFINPVHEVVLRKMNKDRFIDFDTTKEILDQGYIGRIFNMNILKSVMVPQDTIFFTAEPEFFGRICVGQDITVLNSDDTKKRHLGFTLFEQVGIYVNGDKGLASIKIS